MRKMIFLFFCFCSCFCHAQQKAVTDSGKVVILNNNGTWNYVESSSEEKLNQEPGDSAIKKYFRSSLSNTILKSKKNKMALWYNAKTWRNMERQFSEASEFTLTKFLVMVIG